MARLKHGFLSKSSIILLSPIIEELRNDTLGSLLHITDIGYYPKAEFHFRKREEEEEEEDLLYCRFWLV